MAEIISSLRRETLGRMTMGEKRLAAVRPATEELVQRLDRAGQLSGESVPGLRIVTTDKMSRYPGGMFQDFTFDFFATADDAACS